MQPATLSRLDFKDLPGWQTSGRQLSFMAFLRSAHEMLEVAAGFQRQPVFGGALADWLGVCTSALQREEVGGFFESEFTPLAVTDTERPEGLFTGYYEPEAEASLTPHPDFPAAIYRKPPDLVSFPQGDGETAGLAYGRYVAGSSQAYLTRREIENGALAGQKLELAWLRSWEDAFFIHIQGQGRLRLTDGTVMRLAYAAKSGRPYTGIGGVLVARGLVAPGQSSMQSIRAWMKANPGEARDLMWRNESFVFFRDVEVPDQSAGSVGAQRVNLTPRRSLAVDRRYWMFGTPLWLDTTLPPEAGGEMFRELMIAQDTGTAIKGAARGDVYWGWGDEAAWIAGHMKSRGRLVALLPNKLASALLAAQG